MKTKLIKTLATLAISAYALTGCATAYIAGKADGYDSKDQKPRPYLKALYVFTMPFDLVTSPFQICWMGSKFE